MSTVPAEAATAAHPAAEALPAADPVLPRIPLAAWAALPILLVAGLVCVAVLAASTALDGAAGPVVTAAAAVLAAPLLARAVRRVSEEVFDLPPSSISVWRRAGRAMVLVAIPLVPAALTAYAAAAAEQVALFHAVVAVGWTLTALGALLAVVALPLATVREEATPGSVLLVAFYATLRRPLPPVSVIVFAALLVWASLVWLPAGLVLVPGVTAVLAVAASWAVLPPAGVALPALAATRTPFVRTR